MRHWAVCFSFVAMSVGGASVEGAITNIPLVNPGFETGTINGWTYEKYEGTGSFVDPPVVWDYLTGTDNQYASSMISGITDGSRTTWAKLCQTITMPDADDVRWSFWVRVGGGLSMGINADGFQATITSGNAAVEFQIYQQMVNLSTHYYLNPVSGTWDVQQYDWWTSFVVTSGNLNEYFSPGETLTVCYKDTIKGSVSQSSARVNALLADVDNLPPDPSNPRALGDNVTLIPEPTSVAIWSLLGALALFKRRKTR